MSTSRDLTLKELTPEEFPETWAELRKAVQDGVAPGFVAGFWECSRPDEIHVAAHGDRRRLPSGQPMTPDTVFDVASVSKVFATATLTAILVDRRWLSWETPVSAIFAGYPHTQIQVRHLLSHTAGFPAWEPLWQRLREHFGPRPIQNFSVSERQLEMKRMILSVAPEVPVETRALYSDISFLLLGFLLEEVTGLPLDRAVKRFVWDSLGTADSFFRRIDRATARMVDEKVAATEQCPWREQVLQGQVHDDNCWAMGGFGGHAGVFSTARDLLHFSRRMLNGFVSRETLEKAWTRVERPLGCERTLGWDTPSGELPSAGRLFSRCSVGHLGFTGTSLWIDPKAQLAVTLLSNRVHPSRENILIRAFRPKFHEAIRRDLLARRR